MLRRRPLAAALLLASSLALAACNDDGSDLASLLLTDVPGYTAATSDSGPLDANGAATSLPTAAGATAQALSSSYFSAGYSRIFLRNGGGAASDYVILSVYAMSTPHGAASFVAFERTALEDTGTVEVFSVDSVPDSTGFVLTGPTKRGNRSVFCDGVIFPHASDVYAITMCSAMPTDASLATQLARQQSQRAVGTGR